MRFFYNIIWYLILPFVFLRLLWRSRKIPEYRNRWSERLGYFDLPKQFQHAIWVHAVSVGESLVAIPLIRALKQKYPNKPIVITTTTPTGSERVQALLGSSVFHIYLPYDMPGSLTRFFKKVKPQLLILIETELWPNVLYYCGQHHVPVMLANARLSERSFKGYSRISMITHAMLRNVSMVAAQAEADANRFKSLGLSPERVQVTGSVKFDMNVPASILESRGLLRQQLGAGRPVWIAGSTHPGEEEIIIAAHKLIREHFPDSLLILVPRHPERSDDIVKLCNAEEFSVSRRTRDQNDLQSSDVFIVDTIGELLLFFSVADVAFVGGSLVSHGGHNLLEPALFELPVLSGPYLFNFARVEQLFKESQAVTIVDDEKSLAKTVAQFFGDKELSKQFGQRAYQVVVNNRGALKRHLDLVSKLLKNH